jgi:RNA polymerase sigma-70 factor (ECF subfamily)
VSSKTKPVIEMTLMTAEVEKSTQTTDIDRRRATWMAAAQTGDRVAYEMLLRDCVPFVKRVARSQGIRSDLIDDVVQETLLTLHRVRQTYDPNRSFTSWLGSIAQRRAIDGLRLTARTRSREIYAPLAYENHSDPSSDPSETIIQIDHVDSLDSAIGKLTARQREAVKHLALQCQSLAQAAKLTGRSTGSIRVDWHRALKTLRTQSDAK